MSALDQDGPGFAQEISVGLEDNGALSELNVTNNELTKGEFDSRYGGYKIDMSGVLALSEVLKR